MYQNRDSHLDVFLDEIVGIADKDYQRRIWIRGEGPECDDFTEAVCRYSNAADTFFAEYNEGGISDSQMKLIHQFHNDFKKFWRENDLPQLFIDTPEWTKITEQAQEVLEAFKHTH